MRQCWVVAQLASLIAGNVVDVADSRKHFGLLNGVDAQIGFEGEVEVEDVRGIAGFLYGQGQDALLDLVSDGWRSRGGLLLLLWDCGQLHGFDWGSWGELHF